MARSRRADWLDQIIREVKPGQTPRADFDAWRDAHAGAIRRLRQRGATIPRGEPFLALISRLARNTVRSPAGKLAMAAAIVAGAFILLTWCTGRQSPPATPPTTATDQATSPRPEVLDPEQEELRLADDLFTKGDVQGLLALLHSTRAQTVFTVVSYLGQIGDPSSVATIQALAAQWQGPSQDNPFQRAIDQIRRGNRQDEAESTQNSRAPAGVLQTTQEPEPSPSEIPPLTCRGVVADRSGSPIRGAEVWAQSCTDDLKLTDLTTPVPTDPLGKFSLTVPTGDTDTTDRVYLLCRHSNHALGWLRLPTDGQTADVNDCRIILYRPTFVAGIVTDTRGRGVPDALVEARMVPAHEPTSVQEYPCTAGNERAVKTDTTGRFILKDVPENSLLSLSVSRRGYGLYDSREGYGQFMGTSPYLDPESHTLRAGRRDIEIKLLPAEGQIYVQVVREQGGLYDGPVILRCESPGNGLGPWFCRYDGGDCTLMEPAQRGICSPQGQGRFRIDDLPVGRYLIAAADPLSGDLITPPSEVLIRPSQLRAQVTLRAARTAQVTVRARTPTGEPVGNLLLTAGSGFMVRKRTNADGLCVFRLFEGDSAIQAHGWDRDSAGHVVRVTPDLADRQIDWPVGTPFLLRGRLVDESGSPVRGSVSLLLHGWVSTDADGRFVIPHKAPDALLQGYARDAEGKRALIFAGMPPSAGGEPEVRLERVAVFTGRVLDQHSNPIVEAPVAFSLDVQDVDSTGYRYSQLRCEVFLSDGRFRLDVPVGRPLRMDMYCPALQLKGRAEPIDPAPGQTYDLGDIALEPAPSQNP
ncbi:MAG: carboxypeptidase regulatory-like domain-containing protein [Phycisphaerae bacterium]|nr:carboxypeptidase regulatory-like domain-containing protein [Phycisphaerae bacterium]